MAKRKFLRALILPLLLAFASVVVVAQEFNTVMMESTFQIRGFDTNSRPVQGTGFVLGRPNPRNSGSLHYVLITAAHLMEKMTGETARLLVPRKIGGSKWELLSMPLRIRNVNSPLWTKHPDADVAVMYVSLPEGVLERVLPTTVLADDATITGYELHPGDELNCLGFPLGATSSAAGFPILRSGKIASYPLIPTKETKLFMLDFPVFPGNSGGPVYFVQSGVRSYGGGSKIVNIRFIIGLVSQELAFTQQIQEPYATGERKYPLGLAGIVPASLIRDTIDLLPPPGQIEKR